MNVTVEDFLTPYSPEVHELAQQTRNLVRSVMPDAVETVRPGRNIISYDIGSSMADWICYIAPFKGHINLGFFRGTELPDPQHLLQGTGKLLRHVKISAVDDVSRPNLRALLESAASVGATK